MKLPKNVTSKSDRKLPKLSLAKFKRRPSRRFIAKLAITSALFIFAVSGSAWWYFVYSSPERVFWRSIENSLNVTSVSQQIMGNPDAGIPRQFLRLQLSPESAAEGLQQLFRSGDRQEPAVTMELRGNTSADFANLQQVDGNDAAGKPVDINAVRGKWAQISPEGQAQIYPRLVFGYVPFANISSSPRQSIMRENIQNPGVYKPDYASIQRINNNGRPVIAYNVDIDPYSYILMLQKIGPYVISRQVEQYDAEQFKGAAPVNVQIAVDLLSSQIIYIKQQGQEETSIHSYGLLTEPVKMPTDLVPVEKLQEKLQALQ